MYNNLLFFRLQGNYSKQDSAFTMEAARTLCERGVVKLGDGSYKFTADGQLKRPIISVSLFDPALFPVFSWLNNEKQNSTFLFPKGSRLF